MSNYVEFVETDIVFYKPDADKPDEYIACVRQNKGESRVVIFVPRTKVPFREVQNSMLRHAINAKNGNPIVTEMYLAMNEEYDKALTSARSDSRDPSEIEERVDNILSQYFPALINYELHEYKDRCLHDLFREYAPRSNANVSTLWAILDREFATNLASEVDEALCLTVRELIEHIEEETGYV